MGRVTELIEYLNSKDDNVEKLFTHITVTEKMVKKRNELRTINREKDEDDSLTAENNYSETDLTSGQMSQGWDDYCIKKC